MGSTPTDSTGGIIMAKVATYGKITKVLETPWEDKRHRHTIFKAYGKVGTTASTLIFFIDEVPELEQTCKFVSFSDLAVDPFELGNNWSLICYNYIRTGYVTKINDDGFVFVSLL